MDGEGGNLNGSMEAILIILKQLLNCINKLMIDNKILGAYN